ncbi:imidazolonepropionase [Owenweeksia hongkongensis]|uniref:imidazolonepropionase n=1 Tax=Owenweeksia hongkongensis TaxID=253245 RepID=UPI003A8DCB88
MKTLIHNISLILHIDQNNRKHKRGKELGDFPTTENAWLLVEDGKIADYGTAGSEPAADEKIDAKGGMLLPTWVDSHTHLVYAGTREDEFAKRLHGMTYEQIANEGGGILNSARKLRSASEEELYDAAAGRLDELIKLGTGAIEIKSGYGLTTESEMKILRVARKLAENFPIPIKTSFLGAHAFPEEFKDNHAGYVKQIVKEMLPKITEEKLADYVDVFCEKGYFSTEEMEEIIVAGKEKGLKSKLHINQFNSLGAIEICVKHDAVSVDHLEVMTDEDVAILAESDTIGTLLPGCSLFLEIPYGPARELIDKNAIVALATDYNPGSSPSGNMNLVVSLATFKMKMTPEEAISAATLNGAAAIELSDKLGSIEKGKRANLIITKPLSSPSFLPYNFGHNHIEHVLINGKIYE